MKKDNTGLVLELHKVTNDMSEKSKKIQWFEAKLNKWVRLFEEAEQENANRHNSLITKINEVDAVYRKETRRLS